MEVIKSHFIISCNSIVYYRDNYFNPYSDVVGIGSKIVNSLNVYVLDMVVHDWLDGFAMVTDEENDEKLGLVLFISWYDFCPNFVDSRVN